MIKGFFFQIFHICDIFLLSLVFVHRPKIIHQKIKTKIS